MEQLSQQPIKNCESSGEGIDNSKYKSQSSLDTQNESNLSSGFDCNICLDLVQDPVITLCGHLYCWPCIYRWMKSKSNQHLNCPVCKAQVSENTLIPLYGRSNKDPTKLDLVVPKRPRGLDLGPRCGVHGLIATSSSSSQPSQHRGYLYDPQVDRYYSSGFGFAGTTTYSLVIDILGEMLYARNLGNSQTTVYSYPNNYSVMTTSSTRLRHHLMRMDRSLSRVVLFLCCCALLCLLLF